LRFGSIVKVMAAGITAALLLSTWAQEAAAQNNPPDQSVQLAQAASGSPRPTGGGGPAPGTVGGSMSRGGQAGPSFGQALAAEYREYVRQENQKYYNRFNASHFLKKAERALGSDDVPPETPGSYGIGGADKVALDEGRTRLVTALEKNARTRVPALAAKAQARYDCWAARAGLKFDADDIQRCRDDYNTMIVLLEESVMPIPGGNKFTRTLTREYLAYADFEAKDQKDWIDSLFFARKGLRSANAKSNDDVLPEPISRWNLHSRTDVPTFTRYRMRLINAFDAGSRRTFPVQSAIAQVRFDCWVERTSERASKAAIEKCRREFLEALRRISTPPRPKTRQWIVYFDFDKSLIRRNERPKIKDAASVAKASRGPQVTVVGHTDRAGSAAYNVALSLRRADAVREALILAGVPARAIRVFARGETENAVRTKDGVRKQANRRATINVR